MTTTIIKNKNKALLIIGPILIISISFVYYVISSRYITTDNAYVKSNIIPITSQVSGLVSEINIGENTAVLKGTELFKIEPLEYSVGVDKAQANLEETVGNIESMRADYKSIEAKYQQASENVIYLEREYNRYKNLMSQNAASPQKSDQAKHDYFAATKELENLKYSLQFKKALLDNDPDIEVKNHSSYRKTLADLKIASLNLARTSIYAPGNGIVTNGTISNSYLHLGNFVQAGMPVLNLVENGNIWIEANFKETDLTHMQVNQNAIIEIDSYPKEKWHGVVESITPATGSEFSILPAQNSSGNWVKVVQRVKVRIKIINNKSKAKLSSGMSAYIKIDTSKYHIF